jgi:opacity protein-like surface antigen
MATALVLELGSAGTPSVATASPLDYQGVALASSGPVQASPTTLVARESYASSSQRPIRRRRPGSYYRDDYGHRPSYFANLGVGSFDPSSQPGRGFYFNGAVGSEMNDAMDLGLSVQWYHRSTGGSQVISEFEDPAGNTGQRVIETSDVTTDLVPVMGFLRVRIPVTGAVQPYVGAGIGWEWLTVDGTDDQGFAFSDDYDGVGAQFFGGANFAVAPNASLYGEAIWNASTVSAEFYDSFYGGTVRDEIDMDGLGLHAGLRFRF